MSLASLPYPLYLKTGHWRRTRLLALARWNGLCENCGTARATEVHHKTYERLGRERLSDLTPLCALCHDAEHVLLASPRDRGKEPTSMAGRARRTAHRQATPLAD